MMKRNPKWPVLRRRIAKFCAVINYSLPAIPAKSLRMQPSWPVTCFNSGPLGGDQEIGALIAQNKMDLIIFLRDPLTAQPHEPDVNALIRLADVYSIPLATNIGTAEILIRGLDAGFLDFRKIVNGNESCHEKYE